MFTLKFLPELEDKYRENTFPTLIRSFKIVFYFLFALDIYIIVVDFFRLSDPLYSVSTRVLMLIFYSIVIVGANLLVRFGARFHQQYVFTTMLCMYLIVLFQDANGHMYYLFFSNVAFTLIYIVFTVSGLRFINAIYLGMVYLIIYISYTFWIVPNHFHSDQLPNLLINWVIAAMASYILEKNSRRAFLNGHLLEIKNKEAKLINEKLEQYNFLKDRLLSVVSHDVQTPLNNINAILQVFKQDQLLPEKSAQLLRKVESQIGGTIGYIQKILFWTKNQMNGFNVEKEEINLKRYLEDCMQNFSWQSNEKNVQIICNVDSEIIIHADKEMLEIVLRNIIANGIKFSNENTSIEIFHKSSEQYDSVCIRDNGIGIEYERLIGLFDLNHNHTVGTKLERGSGLGLSLCAEFMKKLDGILEVDSEIGKGSTFYLRFNKAD